MSDWIARKKARDNLGRIFQAAYDAPLLDRLDWFARMGFLGAWYGLWTPLGGIKLFIVGGVFRRSVKFRC